jgi:polyisoprenoid-binding protein YceI
VAIEKWKFDYAHSSIHFAVRQLRVWKVRGRFTKWTGSIEFDERDPAASRTEVEIDASSIDTKEAERDAHLRSADFLDVDKHPSILFRSTKVEKTGERRYRLTGDLTIRGVVRPVVLDVEYAGRVKDPWGGERIGFTAKTSIDRRDFGLTWNHALDADGGLVGDEVEIDLEIAVVKAKAA